MFGGLAMLLDGNMAVGMHGEDLIVRTDPAAQEASLAEPGVRPFDLTLRPMKGWLLVAADGCAEDDELRRWVDRGDVRKESAAEVVLRRVPPTVAAPAQMRIVSPWT